MDNIKRVFIEIKKIIMTTENYIPRDYQTIGGMWTVDTYKMRDITLQVMDEGWTIKIFTDKVSVIEKGKNLEIMKGTIIDLEEVLESISS